MENSFNPAHRGFATNAYETIRDLKWSQPEKAIARKAFDNAYSRECSVILEKLKKMIANASGPPDIWKIHDYLSVQRRETDNKYDYRYSVLLQVFARLLNENWITEADLQGLREDKIEIIKKFASL